MAAVQIRQMRRLPGRRTFVDVPFRIHGGNPAWIPPLRISVYDRLSPRHPATAHQKTALWVAFRDGRPVGRVAACIDSQFNTYHSCNWAWIGFYDCFDDAEASGALFDAACTWARLGGADTVIGPANYTTNDELGLLVEGFEDPAALLTLENPPYYERLWTSYGWEQAMDLWAWRFERSATNLSERQQRTLARIEKRAGVRARSIDMSDFDAEVSRFFEIYNAAWQNNWAFAPMPEPEIRHLARQLKTVIRPEWAFGLETLDGTVVAVCLAVPDLNQVMRKVRSGRLVPLGWYPLVRESKTVTRARVWALGVRPDYQHLALGPLLYREIVERLMADEHIETAEASWTLASNHQINDQLAAMGAKRSKVWRLYQLRL